MGGAAAALHLLTYGGTFSADYQAHSGPCETEVGWMFSSYRQLTKVPGANVFAISIIAGILAAVVSPSAASPQIAFAQLDRTEATVSIASTSGGSACAATVAGSWIGTLKFAVLRGDGHYVPIDARTADGTKIGATTVHNGTFSWHVSDAKACEVMMTSHRSGSATVNLNSPASKAILLAQTTPTPSPGFVTWYYSTPGPTPTPVPGYVSIGGALGAGNVYNTATNGHGVPGTGILGTGACDFLCYGAPGVASSNVLAAGTDVGLQSFMTLGAPDDCQSTTAPLCPGGIKDQLFAIESFLSSASNPEVALGIDSSGDMGLAGGLYSGAAVIAGAGKGNPNPFPTPTSGSLVSYTGLAPGSGELLLGSASAYARCDYGETLSRVLTCNQPFVGSDGLAAECLAVFTSLSSTGCAVLTNGTPQSLFVGESPTNVNQGGFLYDGPADVDLSAGAYASGSSIFATGTTASIMQVTNNGNGIGFYYNSGLSPGGSFTPTEVAGVNSSATLWASGGVQPNSTSPGGSGGYTPEAFPLGVAEHHPQMLSASCAVTAPSTSCTFPNSFAFTDMTYNCVITAQAVTGVSDSYAKPSKMSITIYSGTTATFSYTCIQ